MIIKLNGKGGLDYSWPAPPDVGFGAGSRLCPTPDVVEIRITLDGGVPCVEVEDVDGNVLVMEAAQVAE